MPLYAYMSLPSWDPPPPRAHSSLRSKFVCHNLTYKGPSEASPGGLGGFPPGKKKDPQTLGISMGLPLQGTATVFLRMLSWGYTPRPTWFRFARAFVWFGPDSEQTQTRAERRCRPRRRPHKRRSEASYRGIEAGSSVKWPYEKPERSDTRAVSGVPPGKRLIGRGRYGQERTKPWKHCGTVSKSSYFLGEVPQEER
jgi:hypothetical protein